MTDISLIGVDKLKTCRSLTVYHLISAVINGVELIAINYTPQQELKMLYDQYQRDMIKQNEIGWPQVLICDNMIHRVFEICKMRTDFIESDNVLTLLHRLLYLERLKDVSYAKKNYHRLLDRVIVNEIDVSESSLGDLVKHLMAGVLMYVDHYHKSSIERELGDKILNVIK